MPRRTSLKFSDGQHEAGTPLVLLASAPSGVVAPDPPAWIADDEELVSVYVDLWQEPVASTWAASDREIVARLALIRRRIAREADKAPASMFSAVQRLESELSLGPRARRLAGISIDAPKREQNASSNGDVSELAAGVIAEERAKLELVPAKKKPAARKPKASPATDRRRKR